MNKNIKSFLISIAVFLGLFWLTFSSPALAADPFFIEGGVEVSSTCEVTDTDDKLHVFPKEDSPSGLLGICALPAAKDAGIINSFEFIDFGFGLFLDSINGVKTSADWDLSWSLYHNGALASVGLAELVVGEGDEVSLIYTSFSTGDEFDKLILSISLSINRSSGGGGRDVPRPVYSPSVEKAVEFLFASQDEQGSFGNPTFTDWAAVAFGANDSQDSRAENLKNYLLSNPDPGQSLGSPVLSFIRRAMALMALGINPYSGTATDYIQKIVEEFDGNQIGDPNLVNDDIFGLLVLRKAGFDSTDNIVQKTTNFILANQKQNGSWSGGVDMTSAAVQTLSLVSGIEEASTALAGAKTYLKNMQLADGGFNNPDSTSWAMQAIAALGEDWRTWKKNGNAPGDYLFYLQKQDGSVTGSPSPVWSTAYAVPSALGKPWGDILQSFQPEILIFEDEPAVAGASIDVITQIAQQLEQIEKEITGLELEVNILLAKTQLEHIIQAAQNLKKQLDTLGVGVDVENPLR